MSKSNSSSNASRALEILLLLGEVGIEGMSLAELVKRIGGTKPATHRTLVSLTEKGFAEPTGRHGYYRLGPAIPLLAKRQERLEPQVQKLRAGMTEFARRTGYTVYLMMQAGVDAVCAEIISRSTRRQFTLGIGGRVPMGVAAGSLALMSILPENVCEQILDANTERYTQHPSIRQVDRAIVREQIVDARQRGYAVNMGYYLPGEGGLGLPAPKIGNYEVDLAISFNAPLELMTEVWMDGMIAELRESLGSPFDR